MKRFLKDKYSWLLVAALFFLILHFYINGFPAEIVYHDDDSCVVVENTHIGPDSLKDDYRQASLAFCEEYGWCCKYWHCDTTTYYAKRVDGVTEIWRSGVSYADTAGQGEQYQKLLAEQYKIYKQVCKETWDNIERAKESPTHFSVDTVIENKDYFYVLFDDTCMSGVCDTLYDTTWVFPVEE